MNADGIVIDRGYLPPRTKRERPDLTDHLMSLEVGDSMWVPCEPGKKWVHVQVTRYVAGTGDNLRCRREVREGVPGVRVMHMPDTAA